MSCICTLRLSLKRRAAGKSPAMTGAPSAPPPCHGRVTTQFGGGKTHALTLLYHLAKGGPESLKWKGVPSIVEDAGLKTIPTSSAVAVFVGLSLTLSPGMAAKMGRHSERRRGARSRSK
jgi:hypothetical protein